MTPLKVLLANFVNRWMALGTDTTLATPPQKSKKAPARRPIKKKAVQKKTTKRKPKT